MAAVTANVPGWRCLGSRELAGNECRVVFMSVTCSDVCHVFRDAQRHCDRLDRLRAVHRGARLRGMVTIDHNRPTRRSSKVPTCSGPTFPLAADRRPWRPMRSNGRGRTTWLSSACRAVQLQANSSLAPYQMAVNVAIPAPGTLALMALGLVIAGVSRRRTRDASGTGSVFRYQVDSDTKLELAEQR